MVINFDSDIISATDAGLVRPHNEDSYGVAETVNGIVCAVCDGMGGHAGGAAASRIAVDCIIKYMDRAVYSDIRQALREALDFANLQIIGTASEMPELQGMGTTACVLVAQNDCVWLAHVGDSRIYLYVAREKRLHRLTKDHSYVQGLVDQGFIYEEEADNHPDKNRILKALGVKEDLAAEIAEEPVLPAKGDIFLICSDGLSGMVRDREMERIFSKEADMRAKEYALMAAAKSAGGLDNITFQLIRISRSKHKRSVFESKSPARASIAKARIMTWIGDMPDRMKYALMVGLALVCFLAGMLTGRISAPAIDSNDPNENGIQYQDSTIQQIDSTQFIIP